MNSTPSLSRSPGTAKPVLGKWSHFSQRLAATGVDLWRGYFDRTCTVTVPALAPDVAQCGHALPRERRADAFQTFTAQVGPFLCRLGRFCHRDDANRRLPPFPQGSGRRGSGQPEPVRSTTGGRNKLTPINQEAHTVLVYSDRTAGLRRRTADRTASRRARRPEYHPSGAATRASTFEPPYQRPRPYGFRSGNLGYPDGLRLSPARAP
jgi:hypothetical protein